MSNAEKDFREIIDFLTLAERLKREVRHSWDATGSRRESVAEHCFQMVLFAFLIRSYLDSKIDELRLIKICICHDLVEAIVGDEPYIDGANKDLKYLRERKALDELVTRLPAALGTEVRELWEEFEQCVTPEARCAKALDNLEAQLQHNIAPLSTWEEREYSLVFSKMDKWCKHDSALFTLCEIVKNDALAKMQQGNIEVDRFKV